MQRSNRHREADCRIPRLACQGGRRRPMAPVPPAATADTVYAIYRAGEGPTESFAVREWRLNAHGQTVPGRNSRHSTLTQARLAVPRGFENVGRHESEHPSIVEVWAWAQS